MKIVQTRRNSESSTWLVTNSVVAEQGMINELNATYGWERLRIAEQEFAGPEADLECPCGNTPDASGFVCCASDGEIQPPDADGPWDGQTYCCAQCGRLIDYDSKRVIGQRDPEGVVELEMRAGDALNASDPEGYDRNGAFDGFQVVSDADPGL